MPFKRDRKKHWDRVYEKNLPSEVGWYQDYPEMSLKLIAINERSWSPNVEKANGKIPFNPADYRFDAIFGKEIKII
jgi:hypothetical protein